MGLQVGEQEERKENVYIFHVCYMPCLSINHRTWEGHVHSYNKAVLVHSRGGVVGGLVGLPLLNPAGARAARSGVASDTQC